MKKMNRTILTIETSNNNVNFVIHIPKSTLSEKRTRYFIFDTIIKTVDNIFNHAGVNANPTIKVDGNTYNVKQENIEKTQIKKCNNTNNNYLGEHVTEEQSAAIARADFSKLPIGAYWTIDGTNYRIMAHDQFYGYNCISTHHVVVMPDDIYSMHNYNNRDINTGGYIASTLKSFIDTIYVPHIIRVFGENHVLSHMHDLTGGDYNNDVLRPLKTVAWLINSYNITGSRNLYGTYYDWQDADRTQFPAFKKDSSLMISKYNGSTDYWWLGSSNSVSSGYFCLVTSSGAVDGTDASDSDGVRPAFLVY